jgi:hypothetical protein
MKMNMQDGEGGKPLQTQTSEHKSNSKLEK